MKLRLRAGCGGKPTSVWLLIRVWLLMRTVIVAPYATISQLVPSDISMTKLEPPLAYVERGVVAVASLAKAIAPAPAVEAEVMAVPAALYVASDRMPGVLDDPRTDTVRAATRERIASRELNDGDVDELQPIDPALVTAIP